MAGGQAGVPGWCTDLRPGGRFLGDAESMFLFVATDNALWHKWFNGTWSGWESLGGALSSGPMFLPGPPAPGCLCPGYRQRAVA